MRKEFNKKSNNKDTRKRDPKKNQIKGSKNGRPNDFNNYDSEDMHSGSANDISWWSVDSEMLKQVASIPFTSATGLSNDSIHQPLAASSAPGLMTFNVMLTPGEASNQIDAVNLAARQIYSYVRHENSGSKNYDPADLMEYILAMDQAYALIAELKRLVGVYNYYNGLNRYVSKYYIEALGYDYDDINGRLPELCAAINRSITDLATKYVPADINLLKRHYWMFSNLFLDENGLKAQAYAFKPVGFFTRRESTTSVAAGLDFTPMMESGSTWKRKLTVDDIKAYLHTVIEPIMVSEDVGIISGDILKAYGSNVFQLSAVATTDLVVPTYNSEVLMQIENMYIAPHIAVEDISMTIEQTNGVFVTTQPNYMPVDVASHDDVIVSQDVRTVNFHADSVTPEMVMIATRLAGGIELGAGLPGAFKFKDFCTEIIVGAEAWYFAKTINGAITFTAAPFSTDLLLTNSMDRYRVNRILGTLPSFCQHPVLNLHTASTAEQTTADGTEVQAGVFTDYSNWTNVDIMTLRRINDYAIRSVYSIRIR